MFRRVPPFRHLAFAALALAAPLTGCDEAKVVGLGPVDESKDADFLEGRRLAQAGKSREALDMFTKVILSRREAPESHLEAGNLCLDSQVKDPLRAIFHFRQFLSLCPESIHARVVQERIRAAEKDFLKTLPFRALDGSADDRVATLQEQLKLVRSENDQLKVRLGAALAASARPASLHAPAPSEDAPSSPVSPPTVSPVARVEQEPASPAARPAEPAKKPSAGGRRTHVIGKGESLAAISRKYYGTSSRWKDILNANRASIKNERDLKVGREVVIPE